MGLYSRVLWLCLLAGTPAWAKIPTFATHSCVGRILEFNYYFSPEPTRRPSFLRGWSTGTPWIFWNSNQISSQLSALGARLDGVPFDVLLELGLVDGSLSRHERLIEWFQEADLPDVAEAPRYRFDGEMRQNWIVWEDAWIARINVAHSAARQILTMQEDFGLDAKGWQLRAHFTLAVIESIAAVFPHLLKEEQSGTWVRRQEQWRDSALRHYQKAHALFAVDQRAKALLDWLRVKMLGRLALSFAGDDDFHCTWGEHIAGCPQTEFVPAWKKAIEALDEMEEALQPIERYLTNPSEYGIGRSMRVELEMEKIYLRARLYQARDQAAGRIYEKPAAYNLSASHLVRAARQIIQLQQQHASILPALSADESRAHEILDRCFGEINGAVYGEQMAGDWVQVLIGLRDTDLDRALKVLEKLDPPGG